MGYPLHQGKWEIQNYLSALPYLTSAPRPPTTKGEAQPRSLSHAPDPRDTDRKGFTVPLLCSTPAEIQDSQISRKDYKIVLKAIKNPQLFFRQPILPSSLIEILNPRHFIKLKIGKISVLMQSLWARVVVMLLAISVLSLKDPPKKGTILPVPWDTAWQELNAASLHGKTC